MSVFLHGDPNWWRQAVIYQVYPRSFADSNGDGLGDLNGITSRVGYLSELGIDAVWLSPFYPSALADGGYDVDDYRDVDPRLGTLGDFDRMLAALHEAGIRVFVDIVPNHSSNLHRWFQDALAAEPGSPERDRYIFREGRGANGDLPPNDWPSHFGPSGWTRTLNSDGTPGQWYLHLFAPEQPDWNWDNPDVAADFEKTLRFWSDRGVDGFRIDVAHALKKDMSEPYPSITSYAHSLIPNDGSHPLFDRDAVHDVYRSWRNVFNEYDPPRVAVAEAWAPTARRPRYAQADELGQAFNFDLVTADWDGPTFRRIIDHNITLAQQAHSSSTWVLSNHDVVRHASRFGLPASTDLEAWLLSDGHQPELDRELGLARARAAALLLLALPGCTYLYQGEEIGLFEVADLPAEVLQDPIWVRDNGARKGRDGCRVPLPWTRGGSSFGFGTGPAHLPQPGWFGEASVEAEQSNANSTLSLYRQAIALRKQLQSVEDLEWIPGEEQVVHFVRPNGWQSFTNFGSRPVAAPKGALLLASAPVFDELVPANTTVWLQ